MSTIEVFYSYSHKDEALRDELDKHLALLSGKTSSGAGIIAESPLAPSGADRSTST